MADLRISELGALAGSNLAGVDELAIVDDSASETKKITVADLIANGVTVISDDTIPGAKILFSAGDITTAALADSAVTTAKVADGAITAAKLADESTVDLVTSLPASGAFAGQLALDTDDNNLYAWDGSSWRSIAAPGSVANINGSTTGEINIVTTTSGTGVTISATIDDTTSAAQFLAGPTGSAGAVGYRTIAGTDLPVATTSAKGGVIVNGNGLVMDGDTIEIDNTITSSATHHVVTYDANGLITGGRVITSADLPFATETTVGAVSVGDGLTVGAAGELSVDNAVTPGEYTKVTVTAQGLVSSATTLAAVDIPDHSAAKLTSGTIGTSLIANDAITADKIADQSTTKFGGAAGSDNVTIFPTGDFQGQFFYDETTQDLYIYTGSSFVPITVLSGNLVNAGAYNASTNQMSSVTSAGSSAGFSVGAALPAPAQTNLNHYVVVDTSGTGTGAAPAVALAPPDMLLSQGVGTEYSLIDVSNAIAGQTASNISLIATGNIVATDVQAGIQELDSEKLQKAGDTMTGALGIGTASSIVFEGSTADDYETTLTVTDPTADRTITFPDVTGNVVTTGDTGTVTSTMITDGTIVNADINASAEIAVSKLADGAAYQILHTDSSGTGVEWTSNVDIPGTLDVTSTATFDSTVTATGLITANGKVSFPAGTAAAPSLYSGTDIDTGIYAPAANEFGVATAGESRLVIDSSGRLLVGTSSSVAVDIAGTTINSELQVAGSSASVTIARSTGSGNLFLARNQTVFANYPLGLIGFQGGDGTNLIQAASITAQVDGTPGPSDMPGRLVFSTTPTADPSPTERMRITSDGTLNIKGAGTAGVTQAVSFNGSAPVNSLVIDSSGRLLVGTSTSRVVGVTQVLSQIETTSNIAGISITRHSNDIGQGRITFAKTRGTSNGASTLVADNDNLGTIDFAGGDGTDIANLGASITAQVDGTPGSNDMPGRLVFSTNAGSPDTSPTERMRIRQDGLTDLVAVNSAFRPSTTASAGTTYALINGRHSSTAGNPATGTSSFVVYTNGNVENTNEVYGQISDIKLKENIVDAGSQWDDFKAVRFRKYNFKEETGRETFTQLGVIAQELELVSPGLVYETPDRDEEGNDLGTTTKGVKSSILVKKALVALQEAMERIEWLEAKVAALEAQ